jgi:hypothetical protein
LKQLQFKLNVEEEREIIEMKAEETKFPDSNAEVVLSILTLLSILECIAKSQSFCSSVNHNFGIRFGTSAIKFER